MVKIVNVVMRRMIAITGSMGTEFCLVFAICFIIRISFGWTNESSSRMFRFFSSRHHCASCCSRSSRTSDATRFGSGFDSMLPHTKRSASAITVTMIVEIRTVSIGWSRIISRKYSILSVIVSSFSMGDCLDS